MEIKEVKVILEQVELCFMDIVSINVFKNAKMSINLRIIVKGKHLRTLKSMT